MLPENSNDLFATELMSNHCFLCDQISQTTKLPKQLTGTQNFTDTFLSHLRKCHKHEYTKIFLYNNYFCIHCCSFTTSDHQCLNDFNYYVNLLYTNKNLSFSSNPTSYKQLFALKRHTYSLNVDKQLILIQKIKQNLISLVYFSSKIEVIKFYLGGSFAKQCSNSLSDIDFYYKVSSNLSYNDISTTMKEIFIQSLPFLQFKQRLVRKNICQVVFESDDVKIEFTISKDNSQHLESFLVHNDVKVEISKFLEDCPIVGKRQMLIYAQDEYLRSSNVKQSIKFACQQVCQNTGNQDNLQLIQAFYAEQDWYN